MENNNQEKRHFFFSRNRKKKSSCPPKKDSLTLLMEMIDSSNDCLAPLRTFSEKQLIQATNNYHSSRLLHTDGWYKWYKGSLEDGQLVSIKKPYNEDQRNPSLLDLVINNIAMAVEMNSQLNSLHIIGICLQTPIPIMVFEFANHNGTLSHCLHHNSTSNNNKETRPHHPASALQWNTRLRIASEIATTVAYLHTAFPTPIIHRDIKSSNVFLDRHHVSKLSDFSLSISLPYGEMQVPIEVYGTRGYISPEYLYTGLVSEKSDVFSFGMLLLELLTGMRVLDILHLPQDDYDMFRLPLPQPQNDQYASFQDYFRSLKQTDDDINPILDPIILEEKGGQIDMEQQVKAVSGLALRCIENNVDERPSMVDVTEQLKDIAKFYSQKTRGYNYGQSLRINWEIQQQLALHMSYNKQEKTHNHLLRKLTGRFKKSSSDDRSKLLFEKMIESDCDPIRSFSAKELEQATNNYASSHLLHRDGWCNWYKGNLNGQYISVKKVVQGNFRASGHHYVINDIVIALHMNTHKNVLKLIGICLETPIPIRVYEFANNRNLSDHIYTTSNEPLLWKSRLRIAMEIAQTVAYLHTAFLTPIIHRDIKVSQVLLDGQYNVAKLSDFELAIGIPEGDTQVEHTVRGTLGFIAPEYLATGVVTEKSDVFSFGVLLLELLTGQSAYDLARLASDDDVHLREYFENHVRSNKVNQILDPKIIEVGGETDVQQQAEAVSWLALRCTDTSVGKRPTMVDVATQLEQIAEVNHDTLGKEDKYGWESFQ